jgi:hypothetical protein
MKTTVHVNPALKMDNPKNALWSVVKLIHVINRNAKRLETGGYIGLQGGSHDRTRKIAMY